MARTWMATAVCTDELKSVAIPLSSHELTHFHSPEDSAAVESNRYESARQPTNTIAQLTAD